MTRFVVVGGGVASAATATGLRNEGFDGEIVIVADEPHAPYERPPLSKELLDGTFERADIQVNPTTWYDDNSVELKLGTRVSRLDPSEKKVHCADGSIIGYDSVVLATGVRARTLPGFSGDRVHALRSIADSERLGERLGPGVRLGILGGSFIGCEVAAIASARGAHVTVFDPNPVPLARALGPEIGAVMIDIHRERGPIMRVGEVVTEMIETPGGVELRLGDGETVQFDELLVGVGSIPNAELAIEAGIAVEGGIVTDEYGRTDAPGVYAIGDVASRLHPGHGRRVRVEHHDTARRHGANVARNLLRASEPFTDEHWFWSNQYGHNLQALGQFDPDATHVVRGSVTDRSFSVFSLADGRIKSVVALDSARDVMQTRKLIGVPHEVTAEQLSDNSFQLKTLLPQRAGARRTEARR